MATPRRVVVTGLGAVTPLGLDVGGTWQALIEGKSGVSHITDFDTGALPVKIAACVKGFDAAAHMDRREARRLALSSHYALAAAREAIAQSNLDIGKEDPYRIGVEIGSALGGVSIVEQQRAVLDAKGPRAIAPTMIPAVLISTASCAVAIRFGFRGPVIAPVAACATGTVALGEATHRLRHGQADVMIAGGAESVMTPLAILGFSRLGALSHRNNDPAQACAPFDANRDGTVAGEGAAVVVLETLPHAEQRGAPILAEVLGYGLTCDAYNLVAPEPTGHGAARAILEALREGGISAGHPDWICAHGTGTQLNDAVETRAIKLALGNRAHHIPVTSIKGALGHMFGAAGSVSAVVAIQAMQEGRIPPTLNYTTPDPDCDLDYVPNIARDHTVNVALVNSLGFGGQDACLILRKWDR